MGWSLNVLENQSQANEYNKYKDTNIVVCFNRNVNGRLFSLILNLVYHWASPSRFSHVKN